MRKIKSVAELKRLSKDEPLECFISLAGGLVRSSKNIMFMDNYFSVINEIDDTEQTLTEKQLMDEEYTNIGVAIKRGALFAY